MYRDMYVYVEIRLQLERDYKLQAVQRSNLVILIAEATIS